VNALKVAVIIPVKGFNSKLAKAIDESLKLDYENFEVIVFPDEKDSKFESYKEKIRVIPTGNIGPAEKRDLALTHSEAKIFAFLDDDAYPAEDWLNRALIHFKDKDIAAVGGPSITPPESGILEHISGHIYSSITASGGYTYRYVPGTKVMEVDDYPSCNFIVRREIFEQLGGFDSNFWPGEDTKLCLDITKKLRKKIIYDPQVLVYHHRRNFGIAHFKQVANYALHRGFFAKRYPETSRRFNYFVPSLLVLYIILGSIAAFLNNVIGKLFLSSLGIYLIVIAFFVIKEVMRDKSLKPVRKLILILPVIIGIIGTHLCYGVFFIKGLISRKLKEETK